MPDCITPNSHLIFLLGLGPQPLVVAPIFCNAYFGITPRAKSGCPFPVTASTPCNSPHIVGRPRLVLPLNWFVIEPERRIATRTEQAVCSALTFRFFPIGSAFLRGAFLHRILLIFVH